MPSFAPRKSRNGRAAGTFALAVVAAAVPALTARANNLASIRLTAERYTLKADGRSTSIINAEIRDERGAVVPDGTRVVFSTTAGRLDTTVATTRNGVARVTLYSGDLPGTTLITANLEAAGQAAPAQTVITFSSEGADEEAGAGWARVDGKDYVGYAADRGVIQAVGRGGRASVSYRSVTISADTVQLNVEELSVRAQGNVTLRVGGEKRTYNNLKFDLRQLSGMAERLDDSRAVPLAVSGPRLEEKPLFEKAAPTAAPAPSAAAPEEGTRPAPAGPQPAPPAPEPGTPTPTPVPTPPTEKGEEPAPVEPGAGEPAPSEPAPGEPAPGEPEPPLPTPQGPTVPPPPVEPAPGAPPVGAPGPEGETADPFAEGGGTMFDAEAWALEDISDSSVTVVAKSIALKPGEELQFRRAAFYIDGQKTVSLPFHVMALGQQSLFREQVVGVGPQGVTVDFPFYYDVRPSGIGTLHLRRGAAYGSSAFSNRPGFSLDMTQAYNGKSGVNGQFEVTGLTRNDWGARLHHGQRFGDTRGTFFVDFPNHSDLFATAQLSRPFRGFTLNAAGSGSRASGYQDAVSGQRVGNGGDLRGQVYLDTDPHSLLPGRKLQYAFNLGTARQTFYGDNAARQSLINTHQATMRLYTPSLPLGRGTSVRQSLSVGQTWVDYRGNTTAGMSLRDGVSVLGSTVLNHSLGRLGGLGFTYDYQQSPTLQGFSALRVGRHRLGLTAVLSNGQAWRLNVNATRSLDTPAQTVYADGSIALGGSWRAGLMLSSTQFSSALRYTELQYRLSRMVMGREVGVYYSSSARRFMFDLAGARF